MNLDLDKSKAQQSVQQPQPQVAELQPTVPTPVPAPPAAQQVVEVKMDQNTGLPVPANPFKRKKKFKIKLPFAGGISDLTIALSIKHLSLMLKSGLSLGDSIKVLSEQTTDKKLKKVYVQINEDIHNGMSLSESMMAQQGNFSDIIVSIITIGEMGGTLEKNLVFLSDYLKKGHDLARKIKGALIYPGVVFLLAMVEMLGMIFFIIPKLEEVFSAFEEIPPFTLAVINLAKFVRVNATFIGLGLVAFLFLFKIFLQTHAGKVFKDTFALKMPVIKRLNKNSILATFARTLNILLESGVPISKALEITANTIDNMYYARVLEKVNSQIKDGKNVADALIVHDKFFPSTFVKMIEVGEQTGSLEENLYYLYEFHSEEVNDISSNLTALLEPILLVVIGGMIGLLAVIIIAPIYQLTGSINS